MNLSQKHDILFNAWNDYFVLKKNDVVGVRDIIMESWIRSRNKNINIYNKQIKETDEEQQKKSIDKNYNFIDIARPYLLDLFKIIQESGYMINLIDKDGFILDSIISPSIEEDNNIVVLNLSEDRVGTNAMGTCLYLDKPLQTWGEENCYTGFHGFTTSAAPIHDKNHKLIGCIGITGYADQLSLHTLGMVTAVAYAIENQIRLSSSYDVNTLVQTYTSIVNHVVSDGIIVIDINKNITAMNKTSENMFTINEADVIGKNIYEVFPVKIDFDKYLDKTKDLYNKEVMIQVKNKTNKYDVSITNLKNDKLKTTGLIIIIKELISNTSNIRNNIKRNNLYSFDDIIGKSDTLKETIELAKIASKGNSNILLMGESGTGKELFAQSIHNNSSRRDKPFIAVNCGALPLNLAESELFGYEGGSFTGSKKEGSAGKFELADGGTIFLDEIGEMPLSIQASLLRVIQNKEVIRIGSSKIKLVDVTIIAATNKNLFESVKNKTFREDLFYRIHVFTINLPPLRERKDDILYLINDFIHKYNLKFGIQIEGVTNEALKMLINYNWYGNVRELENVIERAVQIAQRKLINIKDLPMYLQLSVKNSITDNNYNGLNLLETKEYNTIIDIIKSNEGNVKASCEKLGIGRATLYRKLSKYNIDINNYRK